MKKWNRYRLAGVVLAVLVLLLPNMLWAEIGDDAPAKNKECAPVKECKVEWKDLPEAVQNLIKDQAGDNEVAELEKCTKGEEVYYEAEWVEGGNEVEVCVAPDGKLLGREVEIMRADDDDDDQKDDDD